MSLQAELKPQESATESIKLKGVVTRVFFSSPDKTFMTGKFKAQGYVGEVTIAGQVPDHNRGDELTLHGQWVMHPKYGKQFKVDFAEQSDPTTIKGITRYLSSPDFPGIGPRFAKRIVDAFGLKTLEVIEHQPERLVEVEGIGKARAEKIAQSWKDAHMVREVMLFLQGNGISSAYAWKIYNTYEKQSIHVVKNTPYRLAWDISGIGFRIADKIALALGGKPDAPERIDAAMLYLLNEATNNGHVFLPDQELMRETHLLLRDDGDSRKRKQEKLQVEDFDYGSNLAALAEEGRIRREWHPGADDIPGQDVSYLSYYHLCEQSVAARLCRLLGEPSVLDTIDVDAALGWIQQQMGITLAPAQADAVRGCARHKVTVVTGGPGTGKTTIIKAIIGIYSARTEKIYLAAPTGRAAKRMAEATGRDARTIHRMLDYKFGKFTHNEENPLMADVVIIDEASMIDIVLMHNLLRAIPPNAKLVLVGDRNQLPSVGAGNVLKDIINCGRIPVMRLEDIYRQARESDIVVNAHRIISGSNPQFRGMESDFFMMEREEPEDIRSCILELAAERLPTKYGYSPISDIQVIAPMRKGEIGTIKLNECLQDRLNPNGSEISAGLRRYRTGDKVMQIKNNYEKDVYNGDVGIIGNIDLETREVSVNFEGREIGYSYHDLEQLQLAYAISVHKSQGSEYPVVIMPVSTQHFIMLQRNLLYTAVTRAKKLVVLVGTAKALGMAVRNNRIMQRNTRLSERILSIR